MRSQIQIVREVKGWNMKQLAMIVIVNFLASTVAASQKAQIETRYLQWDAAYRSADAAAMAAMLTSDFRLVTGSGKVISRQDYVKSLSKGNKPTVYKTTLMRISQRNRGRYAWTEEISQMPDKDKHTHHYRDLWVLRRGHWLLEESKTLGEK